MCCSDYAKEASELMDETRGRSRTDHQDRPMLAGEPKRLEELVECRSVGLIELA